MNDKTNDKPIEMPARGRPRKKDVSHDHISTDFNSLISYNNSPRGNSERAHFGYQGIGELNPYRYSGETPEIDEFAHIFGRSRPTNPSNERVVDPSQIQGKNVHSRMYYENDMMNAGAGCDNMFSNNRDGNFKPDNYYSKAESEYRRSPSFNQQFPEPSNNDHEFTAFGNSSFSQNNFQENLNTNMYNNTNNQQSYKSPSYSQQQGKTTPNEKTEYSNDRKEQIYSLKDAKNSSRSAESILKGFGEVFKAKHGFNSADQSEPSQNDDNIKEQGYKNKVQENFRDSPQNINEQIHRNARNNSIFDLGNSSGNTFSSYMGGKKYNRMSNSSSNMNPRNYENSSIYSSMNVSDQPTNLAYKDFKNLQHKGSSHSSYSNSSNMYNNSSLFNRSPSINRQIQNLDGRSAQSYRNFMREEASQKYNDKSFNLNDRMGVTSFNDDLNNLFPFSNSPMGQNKQTDNYLNRRNNVQSQMNSMGQSRYSRQMGDQSRYMGMYSDMPVQDHLNQQYFQQDLPFDNPQIQNSMYQRHMMGDVILGTNPWYNRKKRKTNPLLWQYFKNNSDYQSNLIHPSKYSSLDFIQGIDSGKVYTEMKRQGDRESHNNTVLPLFLSSNKEMTDEYRDIVRSFRRRVEEIDFTNVTVQQLKNLMREYGLNHTGKKNELIERLKSTLSKIDRKMEGDAERRRSAQDEEIETKKEDDFGMFFF